MLEGQAYLVSSYSFLLRPKLPMERIPPDCIGPPHVPLGYVVASEKWRGSQLAQGMQGGWAVLSPTFRKPLFKPQAHEIHFLLSLFYYFFKGKTTLVFEDGLSPVDFYLSSRSCILFISEADLVAGTSYRKRLVRVRNVSTMDVRS